MRRARTITVDGREYRWRRVTDRDGNELVSLWTEQHRQAIVLICFHPFGHAAHSDFAHGLLDQAGWITSGVRVYNLNRPAVAAGLIREALARGWDPQGHRPLRLDGFALLRERPTGFTPEPMPSACLELATQLIERRASADGKPVLAWVRDHTGHAWSTILRRPPELVAVMVAGLIEFGLVLARPIARASGTCRSRRAGRPAPSGGMARRACARHLSERRAART